MTTQLRFLSITFLFLLLAFSAPLFSQTTVTYNTAGTFTWTVPVGVTSIDVVAYGAKGEGTNGGKGGVTSGTLAVSPGSYTITIGGATNPGSGIVYYGGGGGISASSGFRGGGYTSISLDGNQLVLAGGGGGAGQNGDGGFGGKFVSMDQTGTQNGTGTGTDPGKPGTVSMGGAGGLANGNNTPGSQGVMLSGGAGGNNGSNGGGGGGGGFFGGGGGTRGGGGGGASYTHTSVTSQVFTTGGHDSNTGRLAITYTIAGMPNIAVNNAGNMNFGGVIAAGNVTAQKDYTITNTGSGPLTITGITSSNSAEFAIGNMTSGTVAASGASSLNFTVTFDPTAVAAATTSTISIVSNDANSPYTFMVSGQGLNSPPTISCPIIPTVSTGPTATTCSASVAFAATASDPDGGVPSIAYTINGSTVITSPHIFPVGSTVVSAVASDGMASSDVCTFTVMVTDGTPPTFSCPAAMTVTTNGSTGCSIEVPNFADLVTDEADNCSLGSNTLQQSIAAGAYSTSGDMATVAVTLTLTDAAGNADGSNCVVTLTVDDDDAPTFSCPAAMTVTTNGSTGCSIEVPNFADLVTDEADNCSLGSNTLQQSIAAGAYSTSGDMATVAVTLTLTDAAGNTDGSNCVVTLTVSDNTPPTITSCPNNLTVLNTDNDCAAPANFTAAMGTDNCADPGDLTFSYTIPDGGGTVTVASGDAFSVGTTTVTVKASDGTNSSLPCTFSVTVEDDITPSSPVDIGDAAIGGIGVTQQISLENPCGFDFGAATATITGGNMSDFTLSNLAGSPLGAGPLTFDVMFLPTATGPRTATVTLSFANAADQTFEVTGNGAEGNVYDQTLDLYFLTIQEAIDNVPDSPESAHNIYIKAGSYPESVITGTKQVVLHLGEYQP